MITVSRHDAGAHVVELALDRPHALNAVCTELALRLTEQAEALAADSSVRCVVVTSTSATAFCVGADLKERNGFSDAELAAHREVSRAAYRAVLDLPMPAIAAVEGYALGGGLEIALSCDLIVAGAEAVLGLPEVSVGLVPGGGGTQLLTRRVGWSRAAGLVLTGRRVDAAEAARLGVVDELVQAGTAAQRSLGMAAGIAANSPGAVRGAKRAMREGAGLDLGAALQVEDDAWRRPASSPDRLEGIRAFVEKRPPQWSV